MKRIECNVHQLIDKIAQLNSFGYRVSHITPIETKTHTVMLHVIKPKKLDLGEGNGT